MENIIKNSDKLHRVNLNYTIYKTPKFDQYLK